MRTKRARKDVKYCVYDKDNYVIGQTKTLRRAKELLKMPKAKMIGKVKKAEGKTFSGYKLEKIIQRK